MLSSTPEGTKPQRLGRGTPAPNAEPFGGKDSAGTASASISACCCPCGCPCGCLYGCLYGCPCCCLCGCPCHRSRRNRPWHRERCALPGGRSGTSGFSSDS